MSMTKPVLCIFKCNWPIAEIIHFLRLYTHDCPQDIGPWRIKYDKSGKYQTDTTFILLTKRVIQRLDRDYFVLNQSMKENERKIRMGVLSLINYPLWIRVFDIRADDLPKTKETNNLYIPLLDSLSDKQCFDILYHRMKILEDFGLFSAEQWEIKIPINHNNNRTRCAFINFTKDVNVEHSVICRHLFHLGSWLSDLSEERSNYRMSCFWAQTKESVRGSFKDSFRDSFRDLARTRDSDVFEEQRDDSYNKGKRYWANEPNNANSCRDLTRKRDFGVIEELRDDSYNKEKRYWANEPNNANSGVIEELQDDSHNKGKRYWGREPNNYNSGVIEELQDDSHNKGKRYWGREPNNANYCRDLARTRDFGMVEELQEDSHNKGKRYWGREPNNGNSGVIEEPRDDSYNKEKRHWAHEPYNSNSCNNLYDCRRNRNVVEGYKYEKWGSINSRRYVDNRCPNINPLINSIINQNINPTINPTINPIIDTITDTNVSDCNEPFDECNNKMDDDYLMHRKVRILPRGMMEDIHVDRKELDTDSELIERNNTPESYYEPDSSNNNNFAEDDSSHTDSNTLSDWALLYSPDTFLLDEYSSESDSPDFSGRPGPFSITKSWSVPCITSRCRFTNNDLLLTPIREPEGENFIK